MPPRPLASVLALALGSSCASEDPGPRLEPYFAYESVPLEEPPETEITLEALEHLDELAFEAVGSVKGDAAHAARYYAALTVAQRDAAALSYGTHGRYVGDLSTVTAVVTCQFFPSRCDLPTAPDRFSAELADLVTIPLGRRLLQDERRSRTYAPPHGDRFWTERAPFVAASVGSWTPWLIEDVREFRLPPPPAIGSSADRAQLGAVRAASQRPLTDDEKSTIATWAAGPGTKTTPGIWLQIAEDRLQRANVDVGRALFVRSIVAMAVADAEIAAMDSKFTWWAKRPFMRDDTLRTFVPTPSHPSYPSDSVAASASAARVLAILVPETRAEVDSLVNAAAESRVQGGIHFPLDVEAGRDLGRRIADVALERGAIPAAVP
jgi:hypothetical protein